VIEKFYPEYLKLFEIELFRLRQSGGRIGGRTTADSGKLAESRSKIDPEKRRESSVKVGLLNVERGFFTPGHENCILTFESQSAAGKIGGTTSFEKGVGIFDKEKRAERKRLSVGEYSPENRKRQASLSGEIGTKLKEEGRGIFSGGEREKSRQRGREAAENKEGLFAEENLGKGAQVCRERGTGVWGISPEVKQENGKLTMSYRYEDPDHPELGQHAAPVLSRMQKRRGYPNNPENRVRVL
jgi:hypothetical protein